TSGSERQRDSVGAHLGCRRVEPLAIAFAMLNAVVSAEAAVRSPESPAQLRERPARCRGNAGLDPQQSLWAQTLRVFAHALRRAFVVPARAVACRLYIQTVVDPIDDDLRLALRLHVSAHH